MKIAITTSSFGEYDNLLLNELIKHKIEYVLNPYGRKMTREEVLDIARGVDGIIAGTETLDRKVLEKLPLLKVISRCGVGMDNVDLEASEELGIKVCNTPFGPTLAVAELTVSLIFSLLRKIVLMDREIRANVWKKRMGNLLYGKRVGIIGFGNIGQKTGKLLSAFGCDIGYYDLVTVDGINVSLKGLKFKKMRMDELLKKSDIITIHVSGKYEKPLLGAKELGLIKNGAWLVNMARGGLVDESVLYSLLKDGHLSGAALDVFENEPYTGPLCELDNVILTPHVGSYAKESRAQMEMQAVKNLIKELVND